jgi:hypothetical protein
LAFSHESINYNFHFAHIDWLVEILVMPFVSYFDFWF